MSRLSAALDDLRSLDALATRHTVLARRDPRALLLTTLLFVAVVMSFDRYRVAALWPLALYPALLAAQAGLPAGMLLRMIAWASPFALAVGLFNPLLDRAPMLQLAGVPISGGWVSLAAIVLRCALTLAAALVLLAGTGVQRVAAALGQLGVPRVFTMQLLFLHRYLFVLMGEGARLATAHRLRAGDRTHLPLAVHASLLGQLLSRAFDRAQRIHQAMQARGFDAELGLAARSSWHAGDTRFVALWGTYFLCARLVDLPHAIDAALAAAWR